MKKKFCWITTSPLIVNFFLKDHLCLLAKEYDVTLLVNMIDRYDYLLDNLPCKVVSIPIRRKINFYWDVFALIKILFIIFKENFDIVVTIAPKAGLLGIIASRILGVKVRVHIFQGEVWFNKFGYHKLILMYIDKMISIMSSHIIVVSNSEKDFLIQEGIVDSNKATVIGSGSICGVDLCKFYFNLDARIRLRSELNIAINKFVIIYLGRLTLDKGIYDLIESSKILFSKYRDIDLLLVGPDEEFCKEKIYKSLGIYTSRIRIVDYTSQPEDYINAADLLCLPSHREGFGMVIIEAGSIGIPSVCSRIYGVSDAVIDGSTGLLFDTGNVNDLAQKIEYVYSHKDKAKEMGIEALNYAKKNFEKNLVLKSYLQYFKNIL